MLQLALLFCCLIAGIVLRQLKPTPPDAALWLNRALVWFFIPALTLLHLPETSLDRRFVWPIAVPWLVFGVGWIFFLGVTRFNRWPRQTLGALVLTGGISSVSFVGFPIFEMLYGPTGLAMGILMSQAGTFLVVSTVGVSMAAWYGADHPSVRGMLRGVLTFPPFIALALALVLNASDYTHTPTIRAVLQGLSTPFSVVALLSVGLQLGGPSLFLHRRALQWGLAYKLLLAPLLVWFVCYYLDAPAGTVTGVCVLGSSLGPMNTAAIVVSRYRLNVSLASQMVAIGIPLSLPLVFLLYWLLP
ncbi:MAG: transporter [Cytophagales bacterium]|nr:MAG: transporter [Cytophagales bacterium]